MQFRLTPVVKLLVIVNVAMFVIGNILLKLYGFNYTQTLWMSYLGANDFHLYQILTDMFVHADILHILFNMVALIAIGPLLESLWGPTKFLMFYLFCGFGGFLLHQGINFYQMNRITNYEEAFLSKPSPESFLSFIRSTGNPRVEAYFEEFIAKYEEAPENPDIISQAKRNAMDLYSMYQNSFPKQGGASAAIFGLLIGFALLFPNTELMLMFIPIPIKAKYFVMAYIAFEIFMARSDIQGDTVAHIAHLGGALFGFILIKYWQNQRNTFY